ncbi:MAG: response regulator [Gemmatimonadota bacterium]|nr:response regulator [Gemmatimonadota bacterium]
MLLSADWSRSPLGDPEGWPSNLRASVDLCAHTEVPVLIVWGPEQTVIYNSSFIPIAGARHPWALGASAREVMAEIWDVTEPLLEEVFRGGKATLSREVMLPVHRHPFTSEAHFILSLTPVWGESQEVAGVVIGLQDITEHVLVKRRFAMLAKLSTRAVAGTSREEVCISIARELARETTDIPFTIFYLVDDSRSEARLVAASGLTTGSPALIPRVELRAGAKMTGWPLMLANHTAAPVNNLFSLYGRIVVEPWPEAVRQAVILPLRLRRGSEPFPFGYLVLGISPRLTFDTQYAGFVGLIAEHITTAIENAHACQVERKREETLAEIERARTLFFSNLSHEFRTPLTLVLGPITEALNTHERSLHGKDLEVVHRNSLRLLKLVNTLLDFSRIEAGGIRANFRPTHLSMLTTDLASTFRSAFESAGLHFDVLCDPAIPPVQVDRDMWEKIVLNLLSNALKFTLEGSVRVRLRIVGPEVVLEVEDTGLGIPAAELPHIFERFYRGANKGARAEEGTGIGLALTRDLVKLQGGSIEVHSTMGRGTTFRVHLPRFRPELPETSGADPVPETDIYVSAYLTEALRWPSVPDRQVEEGSGPPGSPLWNTEPERARILVADDNADMRDYLARLLQRQWEVETVPDGVCGLEAVLRRPPDLIVADVAMPGVDGLRMLREIRANRTLAYIPILLLSSRAEEMAVAEGLRAGADDYMAKPFAANTLILRVERLIAEARDRAAARKAADAERRRLEMMFNDSPAAALVVHGTDLILEFANQTALEIWGKTADVIGLPISEAIPEMGDAESLRRLREVIDTGRTVHIHNALSRLDRRNTGVRTDAWFDYAWIPLRDEEGIVSSVFIHAFDVTALVAERRVAEHANRTKDEFLATVSHELRTPLNSILGWTSLLHSSPSHELRDRALDTIERSVRSQVRLIEDILDVERIATGKLRLEISPVKVGPLVEKAVDLVRPAAEEKGIRIEVDVPEDTGLVMGDPDRLQQVVCNLLVNSIKFTPEGGTISLKARRTGSNILLRVRDNGVGIPSQRLSHIFDRFWQAGESSSERKSGLGLGLEIVRGLVELHGGTVSVHSLEGVGTMFTVTFPGAPLPPSPISCEVIESS